MQMRRANIIVLLAFFAAILFLGWWFASRQLLNPQNAPSQLPPINQEEDQKKIAEEILTALEATQLQYLLTRVHPEKGIRFTPYTHVNLESDLVFHADELRDILQNKEKREASYTWGSFDGSGEPIEMTFPEYYERFVYDEAYANAPEVVWNQPVMRGNGIDNAHEMYPDAQIVEYHFPSIDPQYGGMDWRSLRLVLEQIKGKWYVVGIIHDEWTI